MTKLSLIQKPNESATGAVRKAADAPAECPSCAPGTPGWMRVATNGVSRMARCECWRESQQRWADGVPYEFQSASIENTRETPKNAKALAVAKAWLEGSKDAYFYGPVGTGKTRLACVLANAAHQAMPGSALFVRVPILLFKLQQQFNVPSTPEEARLFDRCCQAPVLVLDDIGVEKGSDYTRRTLQMLYDARMDAGLRTIWTSNLDLEQLAAFVDDDRLPSRIAGRADVVKVDGDDFRARRAGRDA